VREQVLEERVLGAREEVRERGRVRGPARLDLLGLRHAELVEQHLLELLRGAEVDLATDDRVRLGGRVLHLPVERLLQARQVTRVDRDAGALHARQHVHQRQLEVLQQTRGSSVGQLPAEHVGEVADRGGADGGPSALVGAVQLEVQRALAAARDLVSAQLAVQVADGEVGQVVRPAVRLAQVRRELGVEHDARDRQTPAGQCVPGLLRRVHDLGRCGVREPRRQRRLVGGQDLLQVERRRLPVGVRQRDPPRVTARGRP
jgi:hypothetical protein